MESTSTILQFTHVECTKSGSINFVQPWTLLTSTCRIVRGEVVLPPAERGGELEGVVRAVADALEVLDAVEVELLQVALEGGQGRRQQVACAVGYYLVLAKAWILIQRELNKVLKGELDTNEYNQYYTLAEIMCSLCYI